MKYRLYIALLVLLTVGSPAYAGAQIEKEQALMLEAAAKFLKRDFRGAEMLYTRVIDTDKNNMEGYLQRGLVRKALNNPNGTEADATRARALIDTTLTQNAN